jgi:prepilin-type processing-associated H-X9-DG protein
VHTLLFGEASLSYVNSDHFHFSDYAGTPIPPDTFKDQVGVERHSGSANYVFADGHMETLSWEAVQKLLRNVGSRFVDPTGEDVAP